MNTKTVTEDEFYYFHEHLKKNGSRIVRCVESCGSKGRFFTFTWIERK